VPKRPADLGNARAKRSRKVLDAPPERKNERAGGAGTPRGSNCKAEKSRKNNTRARPETQGRDNKLAVYSGQFWIGDIRQNGGKFAAWSTVPAYHFLDSFGNLKEASDAVGAASAGVA
jgi:hypothetical protein